MSNFISNLHGMTVIGDDNFQDYARQVRDGDLSAGLEVRPYEQFPLGSYAPLATFPKVPRSEWVDRIEEMERTGSDLGTLHRHLKVPILNQSQLPFCWFYGTTKALMLSYASHGFEVPYLSAASGASKVKNYQKKGGWAGEAIEGMEKYGVSTIDYWPEAACDRRYDTPEQRKNAELHMIANYEELPEQDFDTVMSALFYGFPVTLGLLWWRHLVCGVAPKVISKNRFGIEICNSWGPDWEQNGFAVLTEEKATPHEAICVRSSSLRVA